MKRAFTTNAIALFTLLFIAIAIFSFVAFSKTGNAAATGKCNQMPAINKGAEMLWDNFSRRFVSADFLP